MKQNVIYIGLDVEDTQYHGSYLNTGTGEVMSFKCRPTSKGLLNQHDRLRNCFPGRAFWLCYEASYVGYILNGISLKKAITAMSSRPLVSPAP